MKPIIIIGSGLAGYILAKEFRKLDKTTPLTIITEADGRFYSKPLLSSAFTHSRDVKDLVTASAEIMREQLQAEIVPNTQVCAINSEKNTIQFADRTLEYDRLVLAVGATPIQLPLQGNGVNQIYSVNNLQDYEKFRLALRGNQKVGIIGCGLVGTEFSSDLMNGGYEVTVMAPVKTPVNRFLPEKIGEVIKNALGDNGVRWMLEHAVVAVNNIKNKFVVTLDNNETLEFDIILSAVGLKANTPLAEQAGIKINKGIITNRFLQTNFENIYALGDCAEVNGYMMQFVSPLMQCARALAKTLAGEKTKVAYPVLPIILKTPSIPTVFYPSFGNPNGDWQINGNGLDWTGLFYDTRNQLQGFAVTSNCLKDKMQYMKQIRPLFD